MRDEQMKSRYSDQNKIIQVENLAKSFSSHRVVDGISFSVLAGETLGLLGPNGAGKTTTIRMLTGLVRPTSGTITIGGYDVLKNPIKAKRLFDISPQEASFHPHLSIAEDIYFYGRLRGLSRSEAGVRAKETLEWAKLADHSVKNGHQLSGGMQRRLLMARALITDPPILYLDEPTAGLDPQSRHALWNYISELKGRKKTIILTTHYMEEAEMLCDRVIIIDRGKIIAEGSPAKLRRSMGIDSILSFKPREAVAGYLLTGIVVAFFAVLCFLLPVWLFLPGFHISLSALILFTIGLALFFTSTGIVVGVTVLDPHNLTTVSIFVTMPLTYLCGVFFPLEMYPPPLRMLIEAIPLTQAIEGLRSGGFPLPEIAFVWAMAALAVIAAIHMFERICINRQ
jgi:ABC-type multidrug transport system ATPase subunit